MKFGVCCSLAEAPVVLAAGFDYVELPSFEIAADTFNPARYHGQITPVTNLFFPGGFDLYQDDWQTYCQRLFPRANTLGIRTMVVGSGGARKAKDGQNPAEVEAEFVRIVSEMQNIAADSDITLAPESLNRKETNVGTSLGQLATALGQNNCQYTADSYHVLQEAEADNELDDLPGLMEREMPSTPTHVHLGDLPRSPPVADDPHIQAFVSRLQSLNYTGLVSLECRWTDLRAQLPTALQSLKHLFRE